MKRKFPKSIKKYIRREKARIRREVLSLKEQEGKIQELYKKFVKKPSFSQTLPIKEKLKEELVEEKKE